MVDNATMMLTGLTISLLTSLVYTTLTNAFSSGGKFKSKEAALFIVIATALVLGLFAPNIEALWAANIKGFTFLQIFGIIIIIGNTALHKLVNNWKATSEKSLVIYGVGLALFFFAPSLFH